MSVLDFNRVLSFTTHFLRQITAIQCTGDLVCQVNLLLFRRIEYTRNIAEIVYILLVHYYLVV